MADETREGKSPPSNFFQTAALVPALDVWQQKRDISILSNNNL